MSSYLQQNGRDGTIDAGFCWGGGNQVKKWTFIACWKKKIGNRKYVHVYMCTLTSGSRTTTVPCGQGLGIRGSRTHDLCLNCESGCVHCIPAENLTYQLLDWKGWVPHPSNYSCSALKASSNIPWNRESLLCALAHQVIPSSYHWEPLVRVCLKRDCKHPCEFYSHFTCVTGLLSCVALIFAVFIQLSFCSDFSSV